MLKGVSKRTLMKSQSAGVDGGLWLAWDVGKAAKALNEKREILLKDP
jgi:hypothetical protein